MSNIIVHPRLSDHTYQLCTEGESVSTRLAADPNEAPGEAWKKIFGHHVGKGSSSASVSKAGKGVVSREELARAERCGNWGPTKPSELFLKVSVAFHFLGHG